MSRYIKLKAHLASTSIRPTSADPDCVNGFPSRSVYTSYSTQYLGGV